MEEYLLGINKDPVIDDEEIAAFWEGLPTVEFEDEVPNLGDAVLAVGYPRGNKSVTVTTNDPNNTVIVLRIKGETYKPE
jgi:hypothetical protein